MEPNIELLEARIAPAGIITVTTLSDHEKAGTVTLRDALNMANTAGTPYIIDFGPAAHPLKGSITLTSALPAINNDVTINGSGVIINGAGKFQDLSISGGNVTLIGLKLTGGHATTGAGLYINDPAGTITLEGCSITANHAVGASAAGAVGTMAEGGGIANLAGTLTLESATIGRAVVKSQVTGNSAVGGAGGLGGYGGGSAYGGGIFNTGTLSLTNSLITGNTATGGTGSAGTNYHYNRTTMTPYQATAGGYGGVAGGGGICNNGGTVTIQSSTLSGNIAKAGSGGTGGKSYTGANGAASSGGASNAGSNGGNSYAGGNGGNAAGGGIQSLSGSVTIQKSTISGNKVGAGSGGSGGAGGNGGAGSAGGVYMGTPYYHGVGGNGGNGGMGGNGGTTSGAGISSTDSLTISNSTISGNTATAGKLGAGGAGGKAGAGSYTPMGGTLVAGTPGSGGASYNGMGYAAFGGGIDSNGGSITLSQVTIAKNAAGQGGGLSVRQDTAASIHNSTIALNKALVSGGLGGNGGGLYVTLDAGNDPVNLISTIVGQNTSTTSGDVSGTISASYSLIQAVGGATISGSNNVTGHSPLLGALAIHDHGTTQTLLPPKTSPAVGDPVVLNNLNANPDGLTTDQNGSPFPAAGSIIYIGSVQKST